MSTKQPSALDAALSGVDSKYRAKIIESYLQIKKRYQKASYNNDWDAVGLEVGKFCETLLRFIQFEVGKTPTPFGTKINNFADECRKIIEAQSTKPESIRVIIPRALSFLYTMRNKRGIGHVEGDVEANQIDLETITRLADWLICELIRVYHKIPLEEAQALVDALATRNIPDVWEVNGKKRVLKPGLSFKQKTLLLLYSTPDTAVLTEDLISWIEHSNAAVFKRDVLSSLHKDRLIDWDKEVDALQISPIGNKMVEDTILKS